jgi:subtilisin family serine protease
VRTAQGLVLYLLLAGLGSAVAAPPDALNLACLHGVGADAPNIVNRFARAHTVTIRERWSLGALDLQCLAFSPAAAPSSDRALALATDPAVALVQAGNHFRSAGAPPGPDPYYGLQMRGQAETLTPLLAASRGNRVRIAVIDTGVEASHPDLEGQLAEIVNFVGMPAQEVPGEYHGTAVTGLIAATAGNGIGIRGFAPEAEILLLRACWEPRYGYGLCSTQTLAQALNYAIEVRARIINLSLAGPEDPLLSKLVARAIELGASVFGASGEDPLQMFPAAVAGVVSVAQGENSSVSTDGLSLVLPPRQLLSTVPQGRYDFVTGASFATAQASALAADLLALDPGRSDRELVQRLVLLLDAEDAR